MGAIPASVGLRYSVAPAARSRCLLSEQRVKTQAHTPSAEQRNQRATSVAVDAPVARSVRQLAARGLSSNFCFQYSTLGGRQP